MKNEKIIVLYVKDGGKSDTLNLIGEQSGCGCEIDIRKTEKEYLSRDFNEILASEDAGYLITIAEGDSFPGNYFKALKAKLDKSRKSCSLAIGNKEFIWNGQHIVNNLHVVPDTVKLSVMPDKLTGVMLNISAVKKYRMNESLKWDMEGDFLIRLFLEFQDIAHTDIMYTSGEPNDSNYQCYSGIFYKDWYFGNIEKFLIPLLSDCREKYAGKIPVTVQYYVMYMLECRLMANQNNRNKHVLVQDEIGRYRELVSELLAYIDDEVIMNVHDCPAYSKNYQFNRMFIRLKYHAEMLDVRYIKERTVLGIEFNQTMLYISNKMKYNVQLIDYKDGAWEIDASLPDIYSPERVNYYFLMNDKKYEVEYNEGYSLTKYFGESAYKRYTFHARINIEEKEIQKLKFVMEYEGKEYVIFPEFQSHTSRLTTYPVNSYWHFGDYLAFYNEGVIEIVKYKWKKMAKRELKVWKELIAKRNLHSLKFLILRMAYCVTRPYYKKKKIWMFYDKIYKGGDSSEYLYKYAEKKKDGIKKYYLLDKKVPDFKRLKAEGYRPLKRNSIKHRLVFLNADMMIVSNSTVFAFNGYYLENSRYIRGFTDFHVVCVQHGLSVQKIALAQQRLRDNTRLYFCASKYEIENLSRPVYNYKPSALKLTGVPRYDGLVNNDKKRILISPTWRMQSAMLVSSNEGVERDYNPDFKNTEYFKIYNSLINDRRLIDAAKKYGYRLSYVLHPIVSPQAGDFDKNDYVDIIPATGDMSYEKLFCESSLMVTDFSGVQFDFAYMRKPLVYLHHDLLEAHYEEGTYRYDTMAFGEICHNNEELINLLTDYMKNGCRMKEEYVKRADDFFAYNDRNNCERIYKIMYDYQLNNKGDIYHVHI